jgi:hypothetical protein
MIILQNNLVRCDCKDSGTRQGTCKACGNYAEVCMECNQVKRADCGHYDLPKKTTSESFEVSYL